jgi:hypothetical protein
MPEARHQTFFAGLSKSRVQKRSGVREVVGDGGLGKKECVFTLHERHNVGSAVPRSLTSHHRFLNRKIHKGKQDDPYGRISAAKTDKKLLLAFKVHAAVPQR